MNLYNKYNNLPYSDLSRIHKDTGNRPLKLGQFFDSVEFSLTRAVNINAFWQIKWSRMIFL